jgi:hypothetical protein
MRRPGGLPGVRRVQTVPRMRLRALVVLLAVAACKKADAPIIYSGADAGNVVIPDAVALRCRTERSGIAAPL